MLTGKTIVLGVTGGIAAYKSANLASMLIKLHADVHVIMTQNATKFITPMTFETLTNNKCISAVTYLLWLPVQQMSSANWLMASATICSPPPCWPLRRQN